jgi:pimeloyl-ACP methyl ester carboxylesterase
VSRRAPSPTFRLPSRRRLVPIDRRVAQRAVLTALRAGFGSLAALAPEFSAACAEVLFRRPPRHARLVREKRALESGELGYIPYAGGRLATWTLGAGPAVLTLHGWGGHAGRLSAFFAPLVDAGFSVIAAEAPGHGSSSGSFASLPDFIGVVEAVAEAKGPLAAGIGHSAGAAALAHAVRRGVPIDRVVLLAPPANPDYYAAKFAHQLGISEPVCEAMKRRLESRYGIGLSDLRLTEPVETGTEVLVVHDRNDASVPWREGAAIAAAFPGARLVSTRGLGHHKIVRNPTVVSTALRFLTRRPATASRVTEVADSPQPFAIRRRSAILSS